MEERREGTTRLRDIARENLAEPPSRESIDALPPLGDASLAFDLSGISLTFDGLDLELLEGARRRFGAYLSDPSRAPSPLRVTVHADEIEYYVRPESPPPEGYYRLRIVHEEAVV